MLILLLGELIILGESSHINVDNVFKFAMTVKVSAYIISHSGLIFSTLLFRSDNVKFLHVLLSFSFLVEETSVM